MSDDEKKSSITGKGEGGSKASKMHSNNGPEKEFSSSESKHFEYDKTTKHRNSAKEDKENGREDRPQEKVEIEPVILTSHARNVSEGFRM